MGFYKTKIDKREQLQIYYFLDSNESSQHQGLGSHEGCTCIGMQIQSSDIYTHSSWSYGQMRNASLSMVVLGQKGWEASYNAQVPKERKDAGW